MNRSSYFWKATYMKGKPTILIFDRNRGGKSVTNDIENVLEDLKPQTLLPLHEYDIVYRDSEGQWDLVIVSKAGHFMDFEPGDPYANYQGAYFDGKGSDPKLATHEGADNGP
jgi:hypothetical protein